MELLQKIFLKHLILTTHFEKEIRGYCKIHCAQKKSVFLAYQREFFRHSPKRQSQTKKINSQSLNNWIQALSLRFTESNVRIILTHFIYEGLTSLHTFIHFRSMFLSIRVIYNVCDLRPSSIFGMGSVAEKIFYLKLKVEKMRAFAIFTEKKFLSMRLRWHG